MKPADDTVKRYAPRALALLHWSGTLLAIAGIVFVTLSLYDQLAHIDLARFDWRIGAALMGLTLVYALANGLLALAWWHLLIQCGAHTSRRHAIMLYGRSQIAKYVPGNIMHLAGRQAMGMTAGLPGWPLARSTAWELGLLVIAGALFGCLVLPWLLADFAVTASLMLFLVAVLGSAATFRYLIGVQVAHALVWQTVFLLISGLLFVTLASLLGTYNITFIVLPLVGAYVLAWLAGLVTPGAPAGVGVRELVLILLMNGMIGETELLLAVVVGRLITVSGDLVFFGMALMLDDGSKSTV